MLLDALLAVGPASGVLCIDVPGNEYSPEYGLSKDCRTRNMVELFAMIRMDTS